MKTKQFHALVIRDLQRIVMKSNIPLERISDIAKAALDLSRHDEEISAEAIAQFVSDFPDCELDHARKAELESSSQIANELKKRIMKN